MDRPEREPPPLPRPPRRRALLLEPASLIAFWMRRDGFDVHLATDEDELIVRATAIHPDVIVLTGPQPRALRLLRTVPALRPIPVLQIPR